MIRSVRMERLALLIVLIAVGARADETPPGPRLDAKKEFATVRKERDFYVFDPVVGFVHKARARRVYDWPEHPDHRIELRTNNLGFRDNADTVAEKKPGTTRILFIGDSQTDGVVNNRESFVSLLESKLTAAGRA